MDTNTVNVAGGTGGTAPVIMFDTSSGISKEEQRGILSEIEEITTRNRLQPARADLTVKAKKRGLVFPVLVNIIALLLLGGGVFLFFLLQQQDARQFQEGDSYTGLTERQLIQTIRRETSDRIAMKDREIADILAKLAEIDLQLQNLQQSVDRRILEKESELRRQIQQETEEERKRLIQEDMSENAVTERIQIFDERQQERLNAELAAFRMQLDEERFALETQLKKLQEEYLQNLALLQGERVQVLEAARIREENLQIQLIEKTNELNALYEQSRHELGSTRDELYRLTEEWERSALIEGELSGFYTGVNQQIRDGRLSQASATLMAMREFLNTPSFQHLRPIQSRKEFYLASIDVLSEIIAGGLLGSAAEALQAPLQTASLPDRSEIEAIHREYANAIADLKTQNEALEQAVAVKDQTIAAFERQNPNQGQAPGNYEETIGTLRTQNTSLQQTVAARESTIGTLRTQNANLQQTVTARESTIGTLRTQNANLQQTVTNRDTTINTLRSQNTNLQQTVTSRDSTVNTLRTQNANLQQIVAAHENTIKEFRRQNENLQQTVSLRDTTINTLRVQTASLSQTVSARDAIINDLRSQTTNLQQATATINDLRSQTASLQQTVAAREAAINDLRSQTASLQQTVAAREAAIGDLRTQNTNLSQTADQLRQTNEAIRKLLGNQ
ncbi:MAG: hypothetical protein LBD55_07650 [Treponema sp.]|jgi:hypothetical protein|nr:hypothetical protein [Treponema sp.]